MDSLATTPPLTGTRRRSMVSLFAGVALMNTAMVGASAVSTLFASETGGSMWSGSPNAAGVLGTALGALGLATLMTRRGRRSGLLLGYAVAVGGTAVAVGAVVAGSLPLLLLGMLLLGVGNGGAQLSRYAAADLYPAERRGFGLGTIVWGGTVGALVGPGLISPAANGAEALGLPAFAGSFLLALLATAGAGVAVALLPRVRPLVAAAPRTVTWASGIGRALRMPAVKVALTSMTAAQLAMVAVMTMTPLHLHAHGHGLGVVGFVLSAHMIGMFALSPLSGRLADRQGGRATIAAGLSTLVAAALLGALAPADDAVLLPVALFLLGYGWNLAFVGGSRLLSDGLPPAERTEVQGFIDAIVWGASALASLGSGALFTSGGFALLTLVAGGLVVLPFALLVAERRSSRRRAGSDTYAGPSSPSR